MKKEEIVEQAPPEPDNPLMRKKKTPEELAREAEEAELDDFTSKYLFSVAGQKVSLSSLWASVTIARQCVCLSFSSYLKYLNEGLFKWRYIKRFNCFPSLKYFFFL